MAQTFHRDYLVRLPLPLAQLYSRAHNAKDARSRHDNTFYLFEALLKLAAAVAAAAYLSEVEQGQARVAALDRLVARLALPSLGQWLAILRNLARHFGGRPGAAGHPLGHLQDQLSRPRQDRPALRDLFRRIKNGPDGEAGRDQACSLLQVFDALVQYRNAVFGHGAGRFESFYANEMGPLLFPAANEVLAEDAFDFLGVPGSRLVLLTELRTAEDGTVEAGLRELVGLQSERLPPLALTTQQARGLLPGKVAVHWAGRPAPLRLDPLLRYHEGELAEEVLFLNRDRNGTQVEYLSYTTGRTQRDRATAPDLAALLSRATGQPVNADALRALAEQSLAETPSVEALTGAAAPAQRLGDYEVLAEIGRGGMGVVYLARQLSLGRLVALKTLPADLAGDATALARFRREIRHLARCDHPHIVKVLSNGTLPDGQLYYTMEYVPGCDLEQLWRELSGTRSSQASSMDGRTWTRAVQGATQKQREQGRRTTRPATPPATGPAADAEGERPGLQAPDAPVPVQAVPELPSASDDPGGYMRRVAAMARDAALGLQAVHDQHLVHRDIKPGNLMLNPDGSRVVLMDFGLAKGDSTSLSASRRGGLLGTLRYAAPEQLAAAALEVGPAADVRGLGVTLWELLSRRRLFEDAGDERQLATRIHEEDVPRLRSIDPSLDRDLEAIVARATERRTADRIKSAGQLAEYLQLYLEGRPLPIRPPGVRELAGRWLRRHKGLVAAAGAVLAALVLAAWLAIAHHSQQRALAQGAAADLEEAAGLREQGHYAEARAVLKRAQARLAHGGFTQLQEQVAQAGRDVDTAARLEETSLVPMEVTPPPGGGQLGLPALNKEEELKTYREIFRDYGIDVDTLEPEEAAARVRASVIREQLVVALQLWAGHESNAAERDRLLSLVDLADDDPVRGQVRAAIRRKDRAALEELVGRLEVGSLPPSSILLIGSALHVLGAERRAERFVRAGQRAHPSDFLLLLSLGTVFSHGPPEQRAEQVGFLRAAVAVRPDSAVAHSVLGGLLGQAKDRDARAEAEAELREAVRLRPEDRYYRCGLGLLLSVEDRPRDAEAVFRAALEQWPDDPFTRMYFGTFLLTQNRMKEAENEFRALLDSARKVQPRWQKGVQGGSHGMLGLTFLMQKKWKEAEAEFRTAGELLPDRWELLSGLVSSLLQQDKTEDAAAVCQQMLRLKLDDADVRKVTSWLGVILFKQGKLKEMEEIMRQVVGRWPDDPELRYTLGGCLAKHKPQEAVAELQQAVRLRPDYADAHYRLGLVLGRQERYPEAENAFRTVLRLKPDDPEATYQLGNVLHGQKRDAEAAVVCRALLRLRPDSRDGHSLLGNALAHQGYLKEALAELEWALKAFPRDSAQWKADRAKQEVVERLFALDAQLPQWLRSRPLLADAGESLDWARLCRMPVKGWYRTAARYYEAAFAGRPALAEEPGQRYSAACAAALAGRGAGADAAGMDDRERTRLRRQALSWLRADLTAWKRKAAGGSAARQEAQEKLARWRLDNDLAGVRDPGPLAELPEAEQEQWRHFWAEVDVVAGQQK